MIKPWFKFYTANWRSDPALRMCSMGARGLWMEMICLMHEAEPYGCLRVNGQVVSEKQIASLCGCPLRETVNYLAELESCGVFSRDEGGVVYSRRMKRDQERAERDRLNGKGGGNPQITHKVNAGVNPQSNPNDAAGDNTKRKEERGKNQKEKDIRTVAKATRPPNEDFEKFWKAYPKRKGANPKAPAEKLFTAAVKAGIDPAVIVAALVAGAGYDADKIGTEYIPQAVKWLRDRRWEEHTPANPEAVEERARFMAERGYVWRDNRWQKLSNQGEAA